jgi:hypothetical protein
MKKTVLKRKSKSEKRKLEDAIHAEMRRIAINRHPYCVCCGAMGVTLQGGHIIPKSSSRAVRFDLMNLFTQCVKCNGLHRFNQSPYINWFIKEYGTDEFDKLVKRSKEISHYKIQDLRDILEEYKKL